MTFLENLIKLAQPVAKQSGAATKDPVQVMRGKFVVRADEQVKAIKAAAEKDRWFSKQKDDSYVICMRNGNQALPLGEHTHFSVKDATAAVKFLEAAKKAVQAGEFDELFKTTAFRRKLKDLEKPLHSAPVQ